MHTPAQDADGNDYSGVITPRLSVDDVRQILATQAALKKQLGPSRTPSRPARSKKTPPRDPPCRARRFTPLHAARASLPPCLAAHPVLRKCRSLAHHHRCFLYPCLSPLPPRRRHAVARRAPASSGREVDALELALPGERLLMRPEFGDRGCSSVLMMVHQTIPRPLSRSARVSSVSRYVW